MPVLEVRNVHFSYGQVRVLKDISFSVSKGEIVAILGPNGAGKTTLLNVIAGLRRPRSGQILLDGVDVTRASAARLVKQGVILIPEGRQVFSELTVEENLLLGGWVRRRAGPLRSDLSEVFDMFPRLKERRRQVAGTLSGGEQQMLAIGRGMMAKPRLLVLDEPSLGLAPLVVRQIMTTVSELRSMGTTVVLVEQNARAALRTADRGYVIETGRILFGGPTAELRSDDRVIAVYMGSGTPEKGGSADEPLQI